MTFCTNNCVNLVLMRVSIPNKVSVSLALQSLTDAVSDVDEASLALRESRGVRDDLIRDAYDNKVPVLHLVRVTGLSREAIYRITHKGRVQPEESGVQGQ